LFGFIGFMIHESNILGVLLCDQTRNLTIGFSRERRRVFSRKHRPTEHSLSARRRLGELLLPNS
jgi:hypothetical protein